MKKTGLFLMTLVLLVMVFAFTAFAHAVGNNLAFLYGSATQSSDLIGGYASRAIDNNTDGEWLSGSVTHTGNDFMAWWQVDLGATYNLDSIAVWNRVCDGCSDRLTNFHVSVLDSSMLEVWGQDYFIGGGYPDPTLGILLPGNSYGQFVKIQLHDTNFLSLAEVEVYEAEVRNKLAVAPEPVSSTLFVVGGLMLGLRRFRKTSVGTV